MRKLITTPKFERALRKFTKRNLELREKVQKTLEQMEEDVFAASLATHKLGGSLDGINACSCGYDCRILFSLDIFRTCHQLTQLPRRQRGGD